jgi:hypothetical protein
MAHRFDIDAVEQRARSAGYRDGLTELFAATVMLTFALLWLTGPWAIGIAAAFVVIFGWKVVLRIKERVTYPRIGYSGDRPDGEAANPRGMLATMGAAALISMIVVAVVGGLDDASAWRRVAPLFSGLAFSGGFWYLGERSGFIRHRLLAVASVATGILFWAVGDGADYTTMAYQLGTMGAILAATGVAALVAFLRRHPAPGEVSDG